MLHRTPLYCSLDILVAQWIKILFFLSFLHFSIDSQNSFFPELNFSLCFPEHLSIAPSTSSLHNGSKYYKALSTSSSGIFAKSKRAHVSKNVRRIGNCELWPYSVIQDSNLRALDSYFFFAQNISMANGKDHTEFWVCSLSNNGDKTSRTAIAV